MAITPLPTAPHPVLACADSIACALDGVLDVDLAMASTAQKRDALHLLTNLADRVEALRLDVIVESVDVAEADSARRISHWLTPRALTGSAPQARAENMATALKHSYPRLRSAVRRGAANLLQAQVVIRALDMLSDDVPLHIRTEAEERLVEACEHFNPEQLRVLGDKILEVIDPATYDDEERKQVEREHAKARGVTKLHLTDNGDGTCDLRARIPDGSAARLKSILESFTSPRHDANAPSESRFLDPATGQRLPYDRVRGEAFCALLEALPSDVLPLHGGSTTTVVVTIDIEKLRTGLGVATLGDGTRITAAEARRLACQSQLLPAVLGSDSEILDWGRASRLFKSPQRMAAAHNHPTCQAEGCMVPSTWCEAHHRNPWSQGGRTDLGDLILLCPWHHHRVHDARSSVEFLANGDVRFARRT